MLTAISHRLASLLGRRRFERELDEELLFHIEMETRKNVELGMSLDEARATARRSFGGMLRVKEDVREQRGLAVVDSLTQDLRYTARTLTQRAGFSAIVIATLGLGIGANTAIFSAIYGVLLRPLPYAGGDRLVELIRDTPPAGLADVVFSVREIEDYRSKNETFEALVEYHTMPFILLGKDDPERVQTGVVSESYFDVMGIEPHLGRFFGEDDDAVLVLSYEYWRRAKDGDPGVVGTMLEMNDRAHRVVGVLPPLPSFPDANDVYMPVWACPFRTDPELIEDRGARMMRVFGRLKAGKTLEQASADVKRLTRAMQQAHPETYRDDDARAAGVTLLHDELTRQARPTFLLLLATAGVILVIACANVANITLSRLIRRQRELSLRSAMGASRARLVRQLVTESTALAVVGGAVGVALASVGLDLVVGFAARFTPRADEIALDGFVLLFASVVSIATGVSFGALPAYFTGAAGRGRRLRPAPVAAGVPVLGRLRRILVAVQVAASLVLLVGAGLLLRSLYRLQQVDAGFETERVLTMLVDLNWSKYDEPESIRAFHQRLLDDVRAHPGVLTAALGRTFPLARDQVPNHGRFTIERRGGAKALLDIHAVTPDYFRAISVPLLQGRLLTRRDGPDAPPVALVNRAAADRYWPGSSPIGAALTAGDESATIVGVVGNVRQYRLDAGATPAAYVALAQFPLRVTNLVVRTAREPDRMPLMPLLIAELTAIIHAIDPEQAVAAVETLEHVRSESLAPPRLTTTLLSLFALLALLITGVGLSGIVALSVSHRRNELGIRMALGASPARVTRLVSSEGVKLVGVGIAIGFVASLGLGSVLSGHLFEVEPTDPLTIAAVSVVLVAAAALACWIPARRATRIDPIEALRAE